MNTHLMKINYNARSNCIEYGKLLKDVPTRQNFLSVEQGLQSEIERN